MAKFGLFDGGNKEASQEYEGDEMFMRNECVQITIDRNRRKQQDCWHNSVVGRAKRERNQVAPDS